MYLQPKEISQIIFGRVLTLKEINKMIDNTRVIMINLKIAHLKSGLSIDKNNQ